MKYLGKKPARHGAIKFKYQDYVKEVVHVPAAFGHVRSTIKWGELGNDMCSDCTIAGAAHETMLWSRAAHQYPMAAFTSEAVMETYQQLSGWNGQPDDPSDEGLDMQQVAEWRRTTGITDMAGITHTVHAYAAVSSVDQVIQATYLFGACGVGIQFPDSASDQFDNKQPWTVVPHSKNTGGHYIPVVGRNSKGNLMCVTWGRLQAMTPDFLAQYMDEAVAYLSVDYLDSQGKSPEMLDLAALNADLQALA